MKIQTSRPPASAILTTILILSLQCLLLNGVVEAFTVGSTTAKTTTALALSMSTSSSSSEMTADASSSSTLTLYGHPGTRSPLVNWAMLELGIEDFTMGDLSKNPHPFKKLPCLTDDDGRTVVFESGAILEYLMDTYAGKSQSILTKSQKAAITSWIVWANASLDPVCFIETPQGKVYDTGLKKSPNGQPKIDQLDTLLSQQQYLVPVESGAGNDGEDQRQSQFRTPSLFSVADVAVASYLLYVPQFFPDADISQWPHLVRYMKDCADRDAYGKAFGKQVQNFLSQRLQTLMEEKDSKNSAGGGGGSVLDSIRGMFN